MRTRAERLARMMALLPMFLILFAGFVWAVMGLWNWLMPAIFSVRTITYWQALGVMLLSWILFGGFRGARSYRGHWEHRMHKRFERMTPAEREEFIRGLRSRCAPPSEPPGPSPDKHGSA